MSRLILLVVASVLLQTVHGLHRIRMYEHKEFHGSVLVFANDNGNVCNTASPDWRNRVSSINTEGGCFILYNLPGCTGREAHVRPGSPSHNNLSNIGFNDAMQSVRSVHC